MQSPQDFMQSFLRETQNLDQESCQRGAILHQKFFAAEYSKSILDSQAGREPEAIVGVEASDTSAKVITVETFAKRQQRYRYLLQLSGTDWRIYDREWECFACHGTGREGAVNCHICGGAGWKNPGH